MEIQQLKADFLDRDFDTKSFLVDQDDMLGFAAACGEIAPRFTDPEHPEFQAPPTFPARFHGRRMLPADLPIKGIPLDAGKAVHPKQPILPGTTLVGKSHLHDIYEKTGRSGRMIFLVSRMELRDEDEVLVSVVDSRMVIRERPAK